MEGVKVTARGSVLICSSSLSLCTRNDATGQKDETIHRLFTLSLTWLLYVMDPWTEYKR